MILCVPGPGCYFESLRLSEPAKLALGDLHEESAPIPRAHGGVDGRDDRLGKDDSGSLRCLLHRFRSDAQLTRR